MLVSRSIFFLSLPYLIHLNIAIVCFSGFFGCFSLFFEQRKVILLIFEVNTKTKRTKEKGNKCLFETRILNWQDANQAENPKGHNA